MAEKVGSIKLNTQILDAIMRDLDFNTDQVLSSIAFQVEAQAKPLAPVDTGALVNSIHTDRQAKNLYWVADGVEYGIYQELGTSRMAAHPFMVPAVDQVARYIDDQWGALF